jgi:hypothetical protein
MMKVQAFIGIALCTSLMLISCSSSEEASVSDASSDLPNIAEQTGFTLSSVSTKEREFLHTLLPENRSNSIQSVVLLRDEDRTAAAYWYEHAETKKHMEVLTERMFDLFSSRMMNLVDEVIERDGYHPIDVLAFTDPVLSDERFVFALIGNTLYEFHVREENEGWVQGLLLELAKENL